MPCIDKLTEDAFIKMLGELEIGHVKRRDGKDLEPGIPEQIVRPTSWRTYSLKSTQTVKIIDFGESFLGHTAPQTLHTPLSVRAPEVIFQDRIDYRVDLWSMGCMVGELTPRWIRTTDKLIVFTALRTFHWPATFRHLHDNACNSCRTNARHGQR